MTVWHFKKVLNEGFVTRHCRQFGVELKNGGELAEARKHFKERFPDADDARHAEGHSAEKALNAAARERNSVSGPFTAPGITATEGAKRIRIEGLVVNGILVNTHKSAHEASAKIVQSSLSSANEDVLVLIRNTVASGFVRAARAFGAVE